MIKKKKLSILYFWPERLRSYERVWIGSGRVARVHDEVALQGSDNTGSPHGMISCANVTVSDEECRAPGLFGDEDLRSKGGVVYIRGFWALAFKFCEEGP
jgi:hypothetical protein